MNKSVIRGLDKFLSDTQKSVTAYWIAEQNKRLIDYAQRKIRLLGDAIMMYHSKNHMDRTGNLLDSLCWVISYDGKPVAGGTYRTQRAKKDSYLHEFAPEEYRHLFPVYGHALALEFIKKYGNVSGSGEWVVRFAILAPYWAYWEKGFVMKQKTNMWDEGDVASIGRFLKFSVMAEFYDTVKADIKPKKIKFECKKPPRMDSFKLDRMNRRISKSPWAESRHNKRWPSHNNGKRTKL